MMRPNSLLPLFNIVSKSPIANSAPALGAIGNVFTAPKPIVMGPQNSIRFQSSAAVKKEEPELLPRKVIESSSFVMNMFTGDIKGETIFPYPDVLDEEQKETIRMIRESSTKMYDLYDPLKADEMGAIDETTWNALKELGAFGLQVPADYGGIGLNNTQYARMCETLGAVDLAMGIALGSHQSIGFKGILLYGNEEQKARYLPRLAAGELIAAYALTEPSSGSDAGSIRTRAELAPDGKTWILNGNKIWISNGGIADVFTVFAKTPVKDAKTGEMKDKITAFIVERAFGGITSGPPEKKMGIKASNTTEVHFENTPVPAENVLGEVGKGFYVAMNILNNGRFGMAGALTGTIRQAIERATDHANNRSQFGNKLSTYGGIQEKLARMSLQHYVTESIAYMVSGIMDRGFQEFQLESAISKIYASEAAWSVVDETIQIFGGMGYMRDTGLEKVLRDLRIFRIFEGANDILRLFIALTGLQYAGGHLRELQRAMSNPVANLGMIFEFGTKRVKRAVGIPSGPSLTEYITEPKLRDGAILCSKSIESFGAAVEHLLIKYNKNVVHQQMLLNRLANSAIDIFTMIVCLSRAQRALQKNLPTAEHELNMVNVLCSEAAERVQVNLGTLRSGEKLKNFDLIKAISGEIIKNGGVVQVHPLDS